MFRFINQMAHKSHKELLTSGLSPEDMGHCNKN